MAEGGGGRGGRSSGGSCARSGPPSGWGPGSQTHKAIRSPVFNALPKSERDVSRGRPADWRAKIREHSSPRADRTDRAWLVNARHGGGGDGTGGHRVVLVSPLPGGRCASRGRGHRGPVGIRELARGTGGSEARPLGRTTWSYGARGGGCEGESSTSRSRPGAAPPPRRGRAARRRSDPAWARDGRSGFSAPPRGAHGGEEGWASARRRLWRTGPSTGA